MQGQQEKPAGGGGGVTEASKAEVASVAGAADQTSVAGAITAACRDIIAPLVRADGGHLFLLSVTRDEVHIHLTGTCAGCPGAHTTRDKMIQPILQGIVPNVQLRLTTGWTVPDGASELV